MKEKLKRTANVFALVALCVVFGIAAVACTGNEDPPDKDPIPPVKVSDGIDFEVAAGKSKNLTVADYITENDYTAAASSDSQNVTVAVSEGLLTVTGVSEGAPSVFGAAAAGSAREQANAPLRIRDASIFFMRFSPFTI